MSFANSTIRIAFFAARPIGGEQADLEVDVVRCRPRSVAAITAPSTPSGTTSMTANGIDQLSYSAARHRNTTSSESA